MLHEKCASTQEYKIIINTIEFANSDREVKRLSIETSNMIISSISAYGMILQKAPKIASAG